jgi:hypothetical protein
MVDHLANDHRQQICVRENPRVARSGTDDRRDFRQAPLAAMQAEYLTPAIEDRALDVQPLLPANGTQQ